MMTLIRSGESLEIRARAIINAAGPWVEQVLKCFPTVRVSGGVRLVKGSHIVVPRLYDGDAVLRASSINVLSPASSLGSAAFFILSQHAPAWPAQAPTQGRARIFRTRGR